MKMIRLLIFMVIPTLMIVHSSCEIDTEEPSTNLAIVAESSSSLRNSWVLDMNDGETPAQDINWQLERRMDEDDPQLQWVQYEWQQNITTDKMVIYLWDYNEEIPLPDEYDISYWDDETGNFELLKSVSGSDMLNNEADTIDLEKIETRKIRVEAELADLFPANILEWEVHKYPGTPDHPPLVLAGLERDVMAGGHSYLSGEVRSMTSPDEFIWRKASGPGDVSFEDKNSLETAALFDTPGDYVLELIAVEGDMESSGTLDVRVHEPPREDHLEMVHTRNYQVNNPLWRDRIKSVIVGWMPYLIDQINDPDTETGGIDNFEEAAKALRGEPHEEHVGFVFSNAWVLQAIESICLALMVDPQGDPEIKAAQEKMEDTLEEWIPKILAAQEPDGYLQTAYTLRDTTEWQTRWQSEQRRAHEGYVAGYFLEAAINHYIYTEGNDTRLYDAAKKLADCWDENIGPDKIHWYDGHQGIKQGLIRFARLVNEVEGEGEGDRYVELARFLLDNRGDGSEYDQSHLPSHKQYEAVGHAVRAVYSYNGMAGIAAETNELDYHSAAKSLSNNIINKKYYITGGIGSGETSEGFGPNYSLPNNSYCETCASIGQVFFQHTMNSIHHDAKYADHYEETIYNGLLGSLDLDGENFYYPNPLIETQPRIPWHHCPCCVGNIPRAFLMIPTWTYQKSDEGVYVNLFIGSSVEVKDVAGTNVEIIQETDYPWDGDVSFTVNPSQTEEFSMYIRIPDRNTSKLYDAEPKVEGINSITINGDPVQPNIENGYAVFTRQWEEGDKIEMTLPMEIQVVRADERIENNIGKVALRYGPLVYNVEEADQPDIERPLRTSPLTLEWRGDLLNGVMTINGQWADGTPMMAIPNYARTNRYDETEEENPVHSIVWINEE